MCSRNDAILVREGSRPGLTARPMPQRQLPFKADTVAPAHGGAPGAIAMVSSPWQRPAHSMSGVGYMPKSSEDIQYRRGSTSCPFSKGPCPRHSTDCRTRNMIAGESETPLNQRHRLVDSTTNATNVERKEEKQGYVDTLTVSR